MRILYNKTVKNKKAGKCFYTYLPVMEVTMAIKKSKPKNSNGDGSIAYEKERNKRCLPIRKHREAREKRYSFGYAVFLILALMK